MWGATASGDYQSRCTSSITVRMLWRCGGKWDEEKGGFGRVGFYANGF